MFWQVPAMSGSTEVGELPYLQAGKGPTSFRSFWCRLQVARLFAFTTGYSNRFRQAGKGPASFRVPGRSLSGRPEGR
jgi:hypothetical protein